MQFWRRPLLFQYVLRQVKRPPVNSWQTIVRNLISHILQYCFHQYDIAEGYKYYICDWHSSLSPPAAYWYKFIIAFYINTELNHMSTVFTRGQYWPSGIVVACVCLCVCVRPCVNHELVRAITHDPYQLGSPNLDRKCKRPWSRSLMFLGVIDLDLQGQI